MAKPLWKAQALLRENNLKPFPRDEIVAEKSPVDKKIAYLRYNCIPMVGKESEDWTEGYISEYIKENTASRIPRMLDKGYKLSELHILWSQRAQAVFSDKRGDLFVIKVEKADYVAAPVLDSETWDAPIWVPRVHPVTGTVYTTRWNNKVKITPETAQDYVAIGGDKYREVVRGRVNLSNIPQSWSVSCLVPQRVPGGLTAGGRQQEEIWHDYAPSGIEQQRVEAMLIGIQRISEAFSQGRIKTDEDLERVAKETEEMFQKQGILTATGTFWRDLRDFVRRALQKDSLGRRNPSRALHLAAAGYTRASLVGEKARRVRTKAKNVKEYLEQANSKAIEHFRKAAEVLDRIAGLSKYKGVYAFRKNIATLTRSEALSISEINKGVIENDLKPVQAAPWLFPARSAEALLMGVNKKTDEEKERFAKTLEAGGELGLLVQHSAEDYLGRRDTVGVRNMMGEAHARLIGALQNPDFFETTVFR